MTSWDLSRLLPLMLEGGRVALGWFGRTRTDFKKDHSIVTQADHEVEELFTRELSDESSGAFLIGEETVETRSEAYCDKSWQGTAWVLDPIDGTAPYANGLPTWGLSLGLMERGVLKEGAVFLAALGELFYTDRGKSYLQRLGSSSNQWELGPPELLKPAPPRLEDGVMLTLSQQFLRNGGWKLPYYVQLTGSSVFSLTKLACGSYGAYTARLKLWDFAGAWPLAWNLGYRGLMIPDHDFGTDMNGQLWMDPGPQRWTTRETVIFGIPSALEALRDSLELGKQP